MIALIAAVALPATASGRVTYPGPRFGVPFQIRLSGSTHKSWTITEQTVFCEYSGSGSQTVTFHTAGWTRARIFSVDRLHSPRNDTYELEADIPLVVTVTRDDRTTMNPPEPGRSCGPVTPHNCGTHTVRVSLIPVRVRNHVVELDLMRNGTPGPLANAVDQFYAGTSNCRFPTVEDVIKARIPWPGNRRFLRPGSLGTFSVRQSRTRPASVTAGDTLQSWGSSEQFSASFSLKTRNRCQRAPAAVRRRLGEICNARNGTVLAG